MKTGNVLVLRPDLADPGGVAYYYHLVDKYFQSEKIALTFYCTGKDGTKPGYRKMLSKTLRDFNELRKAFVHYDLIVLNPSMDAKAIIRDGLFHFLAKRISGKKTLVFIHGWTRSFEQSIERYGKSLYRRIYNPDKVCVLSSRLKEKLIGWGMDPRAITVETTVYEKQDGKAQKDPFHIIFLSRFVKGKGCLEAIRTVEVLAPEFPEVILYMVGDGTLRAELEQYTADHGLESHVKFTGYLSGKEKYALLDRCGIMLYPTSYGEGMPISLLEGMGMGLAIVSRPEGGIPDIIEQGINGFLVESNSPGDFAAKIRILLRDQPTWKAICERNRETAEEKFEIRNVVKRLEKLYGELVA